MRRIIFVFVPGVFGSSFQNCSQQPNQTEFCADLKEKDFQTTVNGNETYLYFLKNGNISAAITNYGCRIVVSRLPTSSCQMTLGSLTLRHAKKSKV